MNGAPAKPTSATEAASSRRTRRTVSKTVPTLDSTSIGLSRATSASERTGRWITGPSPLANSSPTSSGSRMSKMSANRMAASTAKRRTGCSVTSAAAAGVRHSSRNPYRSRSARYSGR